MSRHAQPGRRQSSRPSYQLLGILALLCLLVSPTAAQDASASPSITSFVTSATGAPRAPQTKTVSVGYGDHVLSPDVTQAEVGDIVRFQFYPANHSLVRAEYMLPCIPYEMTGRDKVGFFSGFKPVDVILSDPPTYDLKINDSNPIFYYCSAPGSCINYQMVGVINPNRTTSFKAHKEAAGKAKFMLNPGEPFPAEASSLSSLMANPTAAPTSTGSPAPGDNQSSGLSTGAIIGIAVGGGIALILLAVLFFLIGRTKSLKQALNRTSATVPLQRHDPDMFERNEGSMLYAQPGHWRHASSASRYDFPPGYDRSPETGMHEAYSTTPSSPRETVASFRMSSPPPRASYLPDKAKIPPETIHEMPAQS